MQSFVNMITEVRLPVGRHCPLPESVVISWNSRCLPFSVACIEFVFVVVGRFYVALFSALEQTHCACLPLSFIVLLVCVSSHHYRNVVFISSDAAFDLALSSSRKLRVAC